MDNQILFKADKKTLKSFEQKKIGTKSLAQIFDRINQNKHFSLSEKIYLKKILTDNINNAFNRSSPPR